jgi:hypothetical protein
VHPLAAVGGVADQAESVLREALSRARHTDDEEVLTRVQINLAEVLIHNGRLREARDVSAEVVDRRKGKTDPRGGWFNKELTMEAKRLLVKGDRSIYRLSIYVRGRVKRK